MRWCNTGNGEVAVGGINTRQGGDIYFDGMIGNGGIAVQIETSETYIGYVT